MERHEFQYPPYHRLIKITLKHRNPQLLNEAAKAYARELRSKLGDQLLGPAVPSIPRVRSYFLLEFLVKMSKDSKKASRIKQLIRENISLVKSMQGFSTIRFNVDVDPM